LLRWRREALLGLLRDTSPMGGGARLCPSCLHRGGKLSRTPRRVRAWQRKQSTDLLRHVSVLNITRGGQMAPPVETACFPGISRPLRISSMFQTSRWFFIWASFSAKVWDIPWKPVSRPMGASTSQLSWDGAPTAPHHYRLAGRQPRHWGASHRGGGLSLCSAASALAKLVSGGDCKCL